MEPSDTSIIQRNLFHIIAGSTLPVIALFVSRDLILWSTAAVAGAAVSLEVARFNSDTMNRTLLTYFGALFKEVETRKVTGATYLLIGSLGAFLFLDKTVAIIAVLFLSLGDPAAAIVGSRYGRLRIAGKSLEGSMAFVAVSLLIGGVFVVTGRVDVYGPLVVGALVAAVVEFIPLPVDDNLTIPMVSGTVMAVLLT